MEPKATLGVGRLLIAVYAVFAVSVSARAAYQLATKFADAPVAYSLSALSALIYVVATVSLAKSSSRAHTVARAAVWFEFIGVIVVGSLSLLLPEVFRHPTVWSEFGIGYGCVPLLLPIVALLWLRKRSR